jgi:hypothetical protein
MAGTGEVLWDRRFTAMAWSAVGSCTDGAVADLVDHLGSTAGGPG